MNSGTVVKLALIALVLLLLPAGTAFAATIHVGGAGSPDCSLPEAIRNANDAAQTHTDCTGGDSSGNIIILFATQDVIDVHSGYSTGLPEITRDLTINGGGHSIYGGTAFTCITITTPGVDLSLNGVVIDSCRRSSHGGAISYIKTSQAANQPRSSLALNDVVVKNSRTGSNGSGGGIYAFSHSTDFPIYVSINRSAIHGNSAGFTGGGLSFNSGTIVTINNSSIYGNTAASRGGGIYATGTLPESSRFTFNHVTITGNTSNQPAGDTNKGGGIRVAGGTLTIRNSIIAGNSNNDANEDCRILGPDDVTIAAMSNNIIGSGATANCPTIQVNGAAVTDPGLAASASSVTLGGVGIVMPFYDLLQTSPAINAAGNCRSITRHDQRHYYRPYPAHQSCDIGAIERGPARGRNEPGRGGRGGSDGGGGDDGDGDETSSGRTSRGGAPAVSTCLTLSGIQASGISQSTQCQRVGAVGIANPNIREGDFVDAVDVWSWVLPNTQICFEAAGGGIKFIDTAAMPRTIQDLAAYSLNGLPCATINGPGILVLMPGDAPPAGSAPAGSAPASAGNQSLSGCMVRATVSLNFRASPGGPVVGGVAEDWLLTAVERTAGWFKVDRLGQYGWISADYVEPQGNCG